MITKDFLGNIQIMNEIICSNNKKKISILICHNSYINSGGEDKVFTNEAELLINNGQIVQQFIKSNKIIPNEPKLKIGANTFWSFSSTRDLQEILNKNKIDVVHFHNTFPLISPSAYYVCKEFNLPVVQTLHNYRLICPNAILYRDNQVCEDCINKSFAWPGILHACYRKSRIQTSIVSSMVFFHRLINTWQKNVDVYIALTNFSKKKFVGAGLPSEKIVVSPNFVLEDPGVKKEIGEYALFVGRISEEKGIKTLLEAWKKIPEIPLKIVGDGHLMDFVKGIIKETNLNNVLVLGKKDNLEVIELMKKAQFLIFPSEWYEGFPMTIVESFSVGLPVIASNIGAMEELIEHNKSGILFASGDADDLAEKSLELWNSKTKLEKISKNVRNEYLLKYSSEKKFESLMKIYESILR